MHLVTNAKVIEIIKYQSILFSSLMFIKLHIWNVDKHSTIIYLDVTFYIEACVVKSNISSNKIEASNTFTNSETINVTS